MCTECIWIWCIKSFCALFELKVTRYACDLRFSDGPDAVSQVCSFDNMYYPLFLWYFRARLADLPIITDQHEISEYSRLQISGKVPGLCYTLQFIWSEEEGGILAISIYCCLDLLILQPAKYTSTIPQPCLRHCPLLPTWHLRDDSQNLMMIQIRFLETGLVIIDDKKLLRPVIGTIEPKLEVHESAHGLPSFRFNREDQTRTEIMRECKCRVIVPWRNDAGLDSPSAVCDRVNSGSGAETTGTQTWVIHVVLSPTSPGCVLDTLRSLSTFRWAWFILHWYSKRERCDHMSRHALDTTGYRGWEWVYFHWSSKASEILTSRKGSGMFKLRSFS